MAAEVRPLPRLLTTPPGLGLVLAFGLTFVFLALRGRRFGRIVPLPDETLRREPVEYIQAMANLYRRSGQQILMKRPRHALWGIPQIRVVRVVTECLKQLPNSGTRRALVVRHSFAQLRRRSLSCRSRRLRPA